MSSLVYSVLGSIAPACADDLQVLKRINAEIEARRAAGEDLPPPPKTAIAGPEYFGLNQPEVRTQKPCTASSRSAYVEPLGLD